MTWQMPYLLALANWSVCLAIAWVCICRLNSETCKHNLRQRSRYVILLAGCQASGLQPILFNEWPGVGSLVFSGAVLGILTLNMRYWDKKILGASHGFNN